MTGRLKRVLWCRWFHRWRRRPEWRGGGWWRLFCRACEKRDDYGRAHMERMRV